MRKGECERSQGNRISLAFLLPHSPFFLTIVLIQKLVRWLPLVVILAGGAWLRLYHVGEWPPGLYRDEGFYGLDALRVLRGDFHLFFAANNGREGLFIYLLAAGIALLGRTPEALRIVSASVGIATILVMFFAARNLFSHRVGVLSAGILAVTFWHVALSRVAYRAITLPLVLCLMVAFGVYAFTARIPGRRVQVAAFVAGALFGLCFYTYTSASFVLVLLIGFGLLQIRALMRLPRATALSALLGAVLALAPLLFWLTQHSDLYLARAGQVSILNPVINNGDLPGTVLAHMGKAALMFTSEGDRIWRHNLALRPVFEGALVPAFLIGVVMLIWRSLATLFRWGPITIPGFSGLPSWPGPRVQFLLIWLVAFLIPTILAEDTPHFLRAIGALPAACIVAALGLEAGLAWLSRRGLLLVFGRLSRLVSPPAALATVVLGLSGVATYNDYFVSYINQPLTRYWLEAQNVALAGQINQFVQRNPPAQLWLDETLAADNASLQFLSPVVEQEQITRVSRDAAPPNAPRQETLLLVDPNHDWTALRNGLPAGSDLVVRPGPFAQGDLDPQPRVAFISVLAYPKDAAPLPVLATAQFSQGIALDVTSILPGIDNVHTVTLRWRTTQPIPEDYAVFVHWYRKGSKIAQHDGTPGEGYLPMPTWRTGDVIVDKHAFALPGGAMSGDEVHVGLYSRTTDIRLNVLDAQGNVLGDSVIIPLPR